MILIFLTFITVCSLSGGIRHERWQRVFDKVTKSKTEEMDLKEKKMASAKLLKLIDKRCVDKKFEEAAYYTLLAAKKLHWPRAIYALIDALLMLDTDKKEIIHEIISKKSSELLLEEDLSTEEEPPIFNFSQRVTYSSDDSSDENDSYKEYQPLDDYEEVIVYYLSNLYKTGYHLRSHDEPLPENLLNEMKGETFCSEILSRLLDASWSEMNRIPPKMEFNAFKRKLYNCMHLAPNNICNLFLKECSLEHYINRRVKKEQEKIINEEAKCRNNLIPKEKAFRDSIKIKERVDRQKIDACIPCTAYLDRDLKEAEERIREMMEIYDKGFLENVRLNSHELPKKTEFFDSLIDELNEKRKRNIIATQKIFEPHFLNYPVKIETHGFDISTKKENFFHKNILVQ